MDTFGRLYSRVLYPAWETGLRGRPTLRHRRYLEKTQWRSLDELTAIQAGDLGRLLRHAFDHVPHYRKVFETAGISPADIRDARDLGKLPILGRDQARDTVAERTATAGAAVEIRKSTSGTLGRPLVFGYERASEYWRQAMKLRGYGWAGYEQGNRSLHFWGGGPPPPKLAAGTAPPSALSKTALQARARKLKVQADRALRREHYIDCGRRGPAELDAVAEAIRREQPEVILCYSQAGADLARHINARGLRAWGTIPVLCGAERLLPVDRVALEAAFGPAVFETYGCREVMLIATECAAHDGQHTSMETLVVEVVVREGDRDRPATPGELGEVVVTDLTNHAMPFIRYANGDLAIAGKPGTCACGRALPRLASVEGRVTETLIDGTGARVNGLVFNVVIAHLAHAIRQFQVVQHKDRSITLRVAPTATFDAVVEGTLRATWERYLPGVPVRLDLVDEILTSPSGKRQVVVVET
jgi:phenylacetate-CoA ligase